MVCGVFDEWEPRQWIWLILCFILPPLAVFIRKDEININVLISIILLILFWFPAVLHAIWYCFLRTEQYETAPAPIA